MIPKLRIIPCLDVNDGRAPRPQTPRVEDRKSKKEAAIR